MPRNKPDTPKKMQLTSQLATKISSKTEEELLFKLENCLLNNKRSNQRQKHCACERFKCINSIKRVKFHWGNWEKDIFSFWALEWRVKRRKKRRVVCGGKQLQEEEKKRVANKNPQYEWRRKAWIKRNWRKEKKKIRLRIFWRDSRLQNKKRKKNKV